MAILGVLLFAIMTSYILTGLLLGLGVPKFLCIILSLIYGMYVPGRLYRWIKDEETDQ